MDGTSPSSSSGGAGQAEERAHVLVDDVGSTGDRIDRLDGAVRLNLQNQLIVVGTLAHAGVGHVHRATAKPGRTASRHG